MKRVLSGLALLLIYGGPILFVAWMIQRDGVNIPFWDEWGLPKLYRKVAAGTLVPYDLFNHHNEHRIFFPRLVQIAYAFLSAWNIKYELFGNILFVLITFISVHLIASKQSQTSAWSLHLSSLLSGLALFSVVQFEGWLWAFTGVQWFMASMFCALAIWSMSQEQWCIRKRLCFAATFCLMSGLSSSHGLFSWLCVIPFFFQLQGPFQYRLQKISFWIFMTTSAFIIQMWDYSKANTGNISYVLQNPFEGLHYLLNLLGAPLWRDEELSWVLGLFPLLSIIGFAIYWIRHNQSTFARELTPWAAWVCFGLMFDIVVTMGRLSYGMGSSMWSRYTISSTFILVGTLQMWRVAFIHYAQNSILPPQWQQKILAPIIGFWNQNTPPSFQELLQRFQFIKYMIFCAAAAGLIFSNSWHHLKESMQTRHSRSVGMSCFQIINYIAPALDHCFKSIQPSPEDVRAFTQIMNDIGLWKSAQIGDIPMIRNEAKAPGQVHLLKHEPQPKPVANRIIIHGHLKGDQSMLPGFVFFRSSRQEQFFDMVYLQKELRVTQNKGTSIVTWDKSIDVSSLQPGEHTLEAWEYDIAQKQFFKLQGDVLITKLPNDSKEGIKQ